MRYDLFQVWALRRLSNGLEGGPWHSGPCPANHHGHRCSCDTHGMVDDTNTRASISRIIILAEALFEVFHGQESSWMGSINHNVVSSIGCVAHVLFTVYGEGYTFSNSM